MWDKIIGSIHDLWHTCFHHSSGNKEQVKKVIEHVNALHGFNHDRTQGFSNMCKYIVRVCSEGRVRRVLSATAFGHRCSQGLAFGAPSTTRALSADSRIKLFGVSIEEGDVTRLWMGEEYDVALGRRRPGTWHRPVLFCSEKIAGSLVSWLWLKGRGSSWN